MITLTGWYFFIKKYTYEYEINTNLATSEIVDILQTSYPASHPGLLLVENKDDEVFIFQFSSEGVSFLQEIRIHEEAYVDKKLQIGVNAKANFFKERYQRFYKETLVQAFNRFVLLQLDKQIALKEKFFQ